MDKAKICLIRALLPHVPFDGWGEKALGRAAADTGMDAGEASLLLPDVAAQLDGWLALMDADMTVALSTESFEKLKVREKIATAIRTRLELAEPHREAVRRAASLFALPRHAGLSARTLWRTADAIWRLAGDSSTDFNHYSKRAIASAVYSATLLYWLQDDSEGRADTWAFLSRRIDGVMRIEKLKARARTMRERTPSLSRFLGRLRYPAA